MKSPLWILNSTLLFSIVGMLLYFFLSPTPIPRQPSIEVQPIVEITEKEVPKINVKRIYEENDLFNTYQKTPPQPTISKTQREVKPIPRPPQEKELTLPSEPVAQFLEPLNISLNGIIYTGNTSTNQAIIADTQTTKESRYSVGDKIFDAYVLRILKNGIIILRSNGQQETIYVSKAEAQKALETLQNKTWQNIIKKEDNTHYSIDSSKFVEKVTNLSQFIEMLDLTTVFKKGEPLGIRIGKTSEQSLGNALGVIPGDIIKTIDGISPDSTKNRVIIYDSIKDKTEGQAILVEVLRNHETIKFEYLLEKLDNNIKPLSSSTIKKEDLNSSVTPKNLTRLQEKYAFNPLAKTIKRHDKQNMLKYGAKNSTIKS